MGESDRADGQLATPSTPARTSVRALQLIGIDDSNSVEVEVLRAAPRQSQLRYRGNLDVSSLVDDPRVELQPLVCGAMAGEQLTIPAVDLAINAVVDPDRNGHVLSIIGRMVDQLGVPVVNPPSRIEATRRDQVGQLLTGIVGLRVPRTARVWPRYRRDIEQLLRTGQVPAPFTVRPVSLGGPGSTGVVRIDNQRDLDRLDRFAFDGRPFDVTEVIDARSTDGWYRRRTVVVVGGVAFPRRLVFADRWQPTDWSPSETDDARLLVDRPDLVAEERFFVNAWAESDTSLFEAMAGRLGLDVFAVDYGVDADGRVVLFELNDSAATSWQASRRAEPSVHTSLRRALADLVVAKATAGRPTPNP